MSPFLFSYHVHNRSYVFYKPYSRSTSNRKCSILYLSFLVQYDRADHHTSSGIGLETTILFAREGANVVMADISLPALEKGAAKVKEVLPHMVGKIDTVTCDVSKESDVAAMVERVEAWGGVDVMFNNAGIMHADDAGKTTLSWRKPLCSTPSDRRQTQSTRPKRSGT